MAVDMGVFELALLALDAEAPSVGDEAEGWLHDPARTAHRLVSVPTAELVEQALGGNPAGERPTTVLPRGMWRILPDRLLSLRQPRRTVTAAEHLHLTAAVLTEWGWAQSGRRIRNFRGGRCIVGAQRVVHALGYGDQHDGYEAGRQIQGALTRRGINMPYPHWNELPTTTQAQALGLVREAAKGA